MLPYYSSNNNNLQFYFEDVDTKVLSQTFVRTYIHNVLYMSKFLHNSFLINRNLLVRTYILCTYELQRCCHTFCFLPILERTYVHTYVLGTILKQMNKIGIKVINDSRIVMHWNRVF